MSLYLIPACLTIEDPIVTEAGTREAEKRIATTRLRLEIWHPMPLRPFMTSRRMTEDDLENARLVLKRWQVHAVAHRNVEPRILHFLHQVSMGIIVCIVDGELGTDSLSHEQTGSAAGGT